MISNILILYGVVSPSASVMHDETIFVIEDHPLVMQSDSAMACSESFINANALCC